MFHYGVETYDNTVLISMLVSVFARSQNCNIGVTSNRVCVFFDDDNISLLTNILVSFKNVIIAF